MFFPSFLALASFMVSLVGTRLLILALRNRPVFLDRPNARSSHTTPVPRIGGVAVITSMVIYFFAADVPVAFILILILLASISLLDDLMHLPPLARFLAHFIAVTAMIEIYNIHPLSAFMPAWLGNIILSLGWVWFINLFNFMDGIDGISASESVCVTLGILLVLTFGERFGEGLAYHSIIVMGAMAGFWWWNRHPARIFLGDVGSIPLGFTLGYFLLQLAMQGYAIPAAILPAYYVLDASTTLIRRAMEKKKIWQAHREHFYQQAASHVGRHDKITHMITGLNILLIMLATLAAIYPEIEIINLAIAYGISGIWALTFARIGKGEESVPI